MNYKAKYWKNKLRELEKDVLDKPSLTADEIKTWVAECVSVFTMLGVSSDVIRGFMNMFEAIEIYHNDQQKQNLEIWNMPARQPDRISGFYFVSIAFKTANLLINKIEESERLVPDSLMQLLNQEITYSSLADTLVSIETSYQSKDIDNLLSSTQVLLQEIINLHPELKKIDSKGIKKQLNYLLDKNNQSALNDFGCDAEIISIFHNFRYLRNKISQHKKSNSGKVALPKPPISVGYSFASLVLLFLFGTISAEKLIKV